MTTPYQDDHLAEAKDELLAQLRQRDNIVGYVTGLVSPVQDVEDDVLDLRTDQLLSASIGAQLDRWGRIVGQKRGDLGDDDFRRFIAARILANLSGGNADRHLEVLRLVVATVTAGTVCHYRQLSGPAYLMWFFRDVPLTAAILALVAEIMDEIRPAGVGSTIVEETAAGWLFDTAGRGFDIGELGRLV